MTILDLKKYFTKNSSINFLNEFTLQDMEDAKKIIYTKQYKNHDESFKTFLDKAADKVIRDKFYSSLQEDQVVVKNTVRDVLNANYKNTITRMILVDSQYRSQLQEEECSFIVQLNEKVVNAVSLELVNIQIPYTFYNIEERQGNDRFILTEKRVEIEGTVYEDHLIQLPTGYYPTLESIHLGFNALLSPYNVSLTISSTTKKMTLTNTGTKTYVVQFLTTNCKVNHCIGWHLGFRKIQGSILANQPVSLNYDLLPSKSIEASSVATVPITKYFVIVVDDFNNNQTADTLIQNNIKPENSKPTSYFTNDPCLGALLPSNLNSYLENVPNRTLTKSQLFTLSQQNLEKVNLGLQNLRVDVHSPNQVLAVIPFDDAKMDWGYTFLADKNKYIREYHSPTNIDRMQIKVYDDKGYLLQLNGGNWCMTLLTNNLYKY